MNEKIRCLECGSIEVVKKGFRKNKFGAIQKYYCKDCSRYFVLKDLANKTYPAKVIMNAISYYNLGNSLGESSKLVNKRFKVKSSPKTIQKWVKEYGCSYYRIRDKIAKKYHKDILVIDKILEHKLPYKYMYHFGKVNLFVNRYFDGLRIYLSRIIDYCPDELFVSDDNLRCSDIKIKHNLIKNDFVKVKRYDNYAVKLASLGLKITADNRKRHSVLQEFMLMNDIVTVAVEVPVYAFVDEINKFGLDKVIDLGDNVKAIVGHIDFIQLKFGRVFILDYKPNASKEKYAWCQLFVYAILLSIRTGIWLRNFRCVWFDADDYFEFSPGDVALDLFGDDRVKEFKFDNKAGLFYTSKYFQKVRSEKKGRVLKKFGLHEKYKLGYKGDQKNE